MAYEEQLITITVPSGTDLSASQFFLAGVSTAGQITVGTTRGLGNPVLGVIQDNSTATGFSAKIGVYGVSKVAASATSGTAITWFDPITCSTAGRGIIAQTSGQFIIGRALGTLSTATGTGLIPVLVNHQGFATSSGY